MYNWTQDLNYTSGQKLTVEASALEFRTKLIRTNQIDKVDSQGDSEIKDFSPLSRCAFYWALSTLLLNLASLQCQPPEGKKILKSLR